MNRRPDNASPDPKPVGWLAISFPLLLAIAISFYSPNFRTTQSTNDAGTDSPIEVRDGPFGGDFLQEYIGGSIIHSESWQQLYDQEYSDQQQHDAQRLKFSWPEDQHFPMVYPPFYYWATGSFSWLGDTFGYPWSARAWLWLNGLAISVSIWLLSRFISQYRSMLGLGVWSLLVYAPLLHNYNLGQKGGLLLLIVTATYVLLHRKHSLGSGLVFGLIAFKPHLGLTIGLVMLLKRQWSFCIGALTTVGLLTGGSLIAFPGLWPRYLDVIRGMQGYVRNAGYELFDSHSMWGVSELLLGRWSASAADVLAIVLCLVVIGFLLRAVWPTAKLGSNRFSVQFSAMLLGTVMLSPHFYSYDLTITLLAIVLIAHAVPRHDRVSRDEEARQVGEPNETETDTETSFDDRQSGSGRILHLLLLALFVVGSISPKVAEVTSIQISAPLLMSILWLLGNPSSEPSREGES